MLIQVYIFELDDAVNQYSEIMEIGRQYVKGEKYDIQFELCDYVRDILDVLRNSFKDPCEILFETLQEYYVEYRRHKLEIRCSNQRVYRIQEIFQRKVQICLILLGLYRTPKMTGG